MKLSCRYSLNQQFFTQTAVQIRRLQSKAYSFVCSFIQDGYLGSSSIRAFSMQSTFVERMHAIVDWSISVEIADVIANRLKLIYRQ